MQVLQQKIFIWVKPEATYHNTSRDRKDVIFNNSLITYHFLDWTTLIYLHFSKVRITFVGINIETYSCNKTYLYQSSLKKHFKNAHEEEYERLLKENKSKYTPKCNFQT